MEKYYTSEFRSVVNAPVDVKHVLEIDGTPYAIIKFKDGILKPLLVESRYVLDEPDTSEVREVQELTEENILAKLTDVKGQTHPTIAHDELGPYYKNDSLELNKS